jgi:tetratricopeptide (TPR) repeat protein
VINPMAARFFVLAVALMVTVPPDSLAGDDRLRDYLDLRRLVGREEYEQAFQRSVSLLRNYPDFPPIYETVAELGLYTRRWDRSEGVFAEQIRQGTAVPLSLYGLASSMASRDDHANAIQCCMEAIDRGLTYSGVYRELAYAYEKAYGNDEALSMLGRLSRRSPRSAGFHYAVAVELWSKGDFRPVVARLEEAVSLDPGEPRLPIFTSHTRGVRPSVLNNVGPWPFRVAISRGRNSLSPHFFLTRSTLAISAAVTRSSRNPPKKRQTSGFFVGWGGICSAELTLKGSNAALNRRDMAQCRPGHLP